MDGSTPPPRPENVSPINFRGNEVDSHELVDKRVTTWRDPDGPEPPLRILSSEQASRDGFLRLEIEVSIPVVELLARAASYLYPLIAQVEQQREKEKERARRRARANERAERMRVAGIRAYHKCRKTDDPWVRDRILRSVGTALDLSHEAVEIARKRHAKDFKDRLRERRIRTAWRLRCEAWQDAEIAEYLGVSKGTVQRYLAMSERSRTNSYSPLTSR